MQARGLTGLPAEVLTIGSFFFRPKQRCSMNSGIISVPKRLLTREKIRLGTFRKHKARMFVSDG